MNGGKDKFCILILHILILFKSNFFSRKENTTFINFYYIWLGAPPLMKVTKIILISFSIESNSKYILIKSLLKLKEERDDEFI